MEGFLNLAWLVPVPPFLAFAAIVLFLNRNKTVSAITAIGGAVMSLLLSWPIAFTVFFTEHFGEHPHEGTLFTIPTGTTNFVVGYQVDPANALMLFMSSFLLVMIFIYASGYMTFPSHLSTEQYPLAAAQGKDPRYSRFMAYISLFATGMLGLIVSNSLLTFFIFWEVMGLCSYLLIGFWYEKKTAQAASIKAFMTTRIGDVIMLIGMMFLYVMTDPSTLQFSTILGAENLHHIAATDCTRLGCLLASVDCRLDLLWHRGQERTISATCLAARCHGRSHTRQRHDPCGDDGLCRCLFAGAHVPALLHCG